MSNNELQIPTKIGDKFSMDRFMKAPSWKDIGTADGFYVCYWDTLSEVYSNLNELLKKEDATIEENMAKSLLDANYHLNEIMVKIKETGGSIPIRDCVKILKYA